MEDNFEELKALKQMLEAGAITNEEFEKLKSDLLRKSMAKDGVKSAMEPSASSLFFKKYKWIFIAIPILAIGIYFFIQNSKPDPKAGGEALAVQYCDCQKQNNEEYLTKLNEIIAQFEESGFEYSSEVDEKLNQLANEYSINTLSPSITACYKNFNLNNQEAERDFPKGSSEGKDFWFAYQAKVTGNEELISQIQKINDLQTAIYEKKESIAYSDPNELKYRKNAVLNKMNGFYAAYSGGYLDAYNFFSYNVEKYLGKKNITPTDINLLVKSNTDWTEPSFRMASETVNLVNSSIDGETWEYATEFQCYRPTKEKYQISNIWYEVKFNKSGKITSYREKRVENTKYFTQEEYNSMNGYPEEEMVEEADY
jgi:hypothetical protein